MSGWKRDPSSLVKKATASGRAGIVPAAIEMMDRLGLEDDDLRVVEDPREMRFDGEGAAE